jgi:hypothetical protein
MSVADDLMAELENCTAGTLVKALHAELDRIHAEQSSRLEEPKPDTGFVKWYAVASRQLDKLTGIDADEYFDVPWHDWYDDGYTPNRAAKAAIKMGDTF